MVFAHLYPYNLTQTLDFSSHCVIPFHFIDDTNTGVRVSVRSRLLPAGKPLKVLVGVSRFW